MERFQLLNGETLVASFAHERTLVGDIYSNIEVHEARMLPIRLRNECSDIYLQDWINRRSVPVNRHHMEAMLGALNLEKPKLDFHHFAFLQTKPFLGYQAVLLRTLQTRELQRRRPHAEFQTRSTAHQLDYRASRITA